MGLFDIFSSIAKIGGVNAATDEINRGINQGQYANDQFADSQRALGNSSFNDQRQQLQQGYQNALGRLSPYEKTGQYANHAYMQALLNPADYAMTPAAQFQMQQGMGGLNNSAMARGGMTGNTLAAMNKFGQGVASQDYNQRLQQLLQASQMGQGLAGQMAGYDMNQGQNMAQNYFQQLGFNNQTNQNQFNHKLNFITNRANNEAGRQVTTSSLAGDGFAGTANSLLSLGLG